MLEHANSSESTRETQIVTSRSTDSSPFPTNGSDSNATSANSSPIDERNLRSASIVDQQQINRLPVAIIGVGAIGSHLAEMLVKLGVLNLTLIDFDEVDTVNLGVQGFHECEVGRAKVDAVSARLKSVRSEINVTAIEAAYEPNAIPSQSAVFSCVDSMKVRRGIFRDFRRHDWFVLFDGRMAAESLRVFRVERSSESMDAYNSSLFPSHEAYRESCTAKSTIYCATMAGAILCALYKRWAMEQYADEHLQFDLMTFDCFA